MTKNFETLEVGREYLDGHGEVCIVIAKHPTLNDRFITLFGTTQFGIFSGGGKADHNAPNLITLIEPVKVVEYWVNVFDTGKVFSYTRLKDANSNRYGLPKSWGEWMCVLHISLENGVLVKSEVRRVKDD